MSSYNIDFPNLNYLLGYFHQGWSRSYDWSEHEVNFEAVVRYFKFDNAENATVGAINDLQDLLSLQLSEENLEEIIDDFTTSGYSPLKTHRGFLERILKVLKEQPEETKREFIPHYIS